MSDLITSEISLNNTLSLKHRDISYLHQEFQIYFKKKYSSFAHLDVRWHFRKILLEKI